MKTLVSSNSSAARCGVAVGGAGGIALDGGGGVALGGIALGGIALGGIALGGIALVLGAGAGALGEVVEVRLRVRVGCRGEAQRRCGGLREEVQEALAEGLVLLVLRARVALQVPAPAEGRAFAVRGGGVSRRLEVE